MEIVSLDKEPSYEALSYAWASREGAHAITLSNASSLPLTENLARALRRLRKRDQVRDLWIDQLCINQSDLEERSQQVSLMGQIYRQARNVLVWLGDFDESDYPPSFKPEEGWALTLVVCNITPRWWSRAWVIQEFAMAKSTPIVCFGPFETTKWLPGKPHEPAQDPDGHQNSFNRVFAELAELHLSVSCPTWSSGN